MSNKNVPATRESGAVSPYVRGMDPTKDFEPPTYRLTQGQSKAAQEGLAKVGQYYSPELAVARDEIRAAVLIVQKTRILWSSEELGSPRCSSDDGINPRPGGEFESFACADCPEFEKACIGGYALLAYDLDNEYVFAYRANSISSLRPVRNFLTAVFASHGGVPFNVATTFKSVPATNKAGQSFAVPVILLGSEPLVGNEAEAVLAEAERYSNVAVVAVEEEPEKEAPKRRPRRATVTAKDAAAKGATDDTNLY